MTNHRPYTLNLPVEPTSCAVFNSPHSGADYPDAFVKRSILSVHDLRSSEDAFVDQFVKGAPDFGAPFLAAKFPRAYVDVNRRVDELDSAVIRDTPTVKTNPRIAAGLGVIPRVVAQNKAIIDGKISMASAQARLKKCYHPYHQALATQISAQKNRFGMCMLFDFHSMPRRALSKRSFGLGRRPQIVLGDRYGTSADRWIMDAVYDLFCDAGFKVVRNAPFAGGYITQNYGDPRRGVHAIQIEIDRSIYMDEVKIQPNSDFDDVKRRLAGIVAQLARMGPDQMALAAE